MADAKKVSPSESNSNGGKNTAELPADKKINFAYDSCSTILRCLMWTSVMSIVRERSVKPFYENEESESRRPCGIHFCRVFA